MESSKQLEFADFSRVCRPFAKNIRIFASGMNRIADIRAAAAAGVPICVDVSRLSSQAIRKIIENGQPVLLDSGAFREVAAQGDQTQVVCAISDAEWERRLRIYAEIAKAMRSGNKACVWPTVSVVAPDRVGSQEVTLLRLRRFREQMRKIHELGADVLVPLQRGPLSVSEFFTAAKETLGIDVVPALPMNKAAMSAAAVLEFIAASRVSRIHLLGIGAQNRALKPLLRFAATNYPELQISTDANKIRAMVGTRRPVTIKETAYCDDMMAGWSGEVDLRYWGGELHDMTEMLFHPSEWLTQSGLVLLAKSLTWLSAAQRQAFLNDPDSFVTDEANDSDWLYQALMQAYTAHIRRKCRVAARSRAAFESLRRSSIGRQMNEEEA
jgi:hypothetical protein